MNNITRSIFRAIHEGRWLSIEYKNQQTQQTKYWVAIRGLNPRTRTLNVDGLHLGKLSVQALDHISIDRIQTAEVVDGSWCPVNQTLIDDIRDNPGRYAALFDNAANLRVLDYLAACNRLDATPYQSNYSLIHQIDADCFADYKEDTLELTDDQFRELVGRFQRRVEDRRQNAARPSLPTLGLNLISIDTRQGLYVLAYRPLRRAPKLAPLITAIGVSFFLEYTAELVMGSGAKVIPSYYDNKTFYLGKVPLGLTSIITLVVTVLSMLVLTFLVQKTKLGKAMRAVSEDMDAARLMGINVNSTISFTFAVGSALAGIGSVLYCCSYPQATPTMGSMLGLKAFVAAVLGGIGSIPGAMIGGIAIGLCECFVSAIGLSAWKDAVTFAILIIVLLVKPTGFLGRKVQEKV